jgi:hypothetical protein
VRQHDRRVVGDEAQLRLFGAERLLASLAAGDIANHREHAGRAAVLVLQRAHGGLDVDYRAVVQHVQVLAAP